MNLLRASNVRNGEESSMLWGFNMLGDADLMAFGQNYLLIQMLDASLMCITVIIILTF